MKRLDGYMAGVNLGGWLSQYDGNLARDEKHFDRFITQADIEAIADFGFDHVRLPFDYPILEDDGKPFAYKESGFAYLDDCLAWCKAAGLNLVLDLHRAPGFSFTTPEANTLFSDEGMQRRFLALWEALAQRYKGEGGSLLFELLNEIVEPDSTRWNALAGRGIQAIRAKDQARRIVVGGIDYNNVRHLKDMPLFEDEGIVYNFHMYEPFALTHQHAAWNEAAVRFGRDMFYPAPLAPYKAFVQITHSRGGMEQYEGLSYMDRDYVERFLAPAFDFIEAHDLPLYCGEYGVIESADAESRAAWTDDVAAILVKHGIGRALWTYKGMSFALVDDARQPLSRSLQRAAVRR